MKSFPNHSDRNRESRTAGKAKDSLMNFKIIINSAKQQEAYARVQGI